MTEFVYLYMYIMHIYYCIAVECNQIILQLTILVKLVVYFLDSIFKNLYFCSIFAWRVIMEQFEMISGDDLVQPHAQSESS